MCVMAKKTKKTKYVPRSKGHCVVVDQPVLSPVSRQRVGTRKMTLRCFRSKVNAQRKCQAIRRSGRRCAVVKRTK